MTNHQRSDTIATGGDLANLYHVNKVYSVDVVMILQWTAAFIGLGNSSNLLYIFLVTSISLIMNKYSANILKIRQKKH
jgi:hypothetical protein